MAILTLTTDFGTNNFYVASLKGLIVSELNPIQLIDISHDTKVFDIQSAAFQVQNAWKSFPQNTLHFIWVGEQFAPRQRFIACEYEHHFFLLPDNGIITLILNAYPNKVVPIVITEEFENVAQFLAKTACDILKEQSIDFLGNTTTGYVERLNQQPIINSNLLRGAIQHIDRYGNLITNITKAYFESHKGNREFEIITRSEQFRVISDTYNDVVPSERLCLFNSLGFLQISINQGNASDLLGLKIGDQIQIEFF